MDTHFTPTLKPLMDSKVLKLVHKGKKSTLQTSKKTQKEEEEEEEDGGVDLSGGIKGDVEVALVALMCEHDSLAVCGVLCVGCVLVSRSLALASLQLRGAL